MTEPSRETLRPDEARVPLPVVLGVVWTSLVLGLCLVPGDPTGPPAPILAADKFWHLVAFAVFALVWRRAGWMTGRTLAMGVAFALAIEGLQHVLPIARSADVYDLIADLLGLGLGLWAAAVWTRRTAARARQDATA